MFLAVIPRTLLRAIPPHVSYRIPLGILQGILQANVVTMPGIIGLGASPAILKYVIRQAPL